MKAIWNLLSMKWCTDSVKETLLPIAMDLYALFQERGN